MIDNKVIAKINGQLNPLGYSLHYYPRGHIKNGQHTDIPVLAMAEKKEGFKVFWFYLQTENEVEAIAEVVRIQSLSKGPVK